MALRRVVQNHKTFCPNGCGNQFYVSEKAIHMKTCIFRDIECNSCNAKVKLQDFAKHCFERHELVIRAIFDKSKHDSMQVVWENKPTDLITAIKGATIGKTGKFYCGKSVDACTACCGG